LILAAIRSQIDIALALSSFSSISPEWATATRGRVQLVYIYILYIYDNNRPNTVPLRSRQLHEALCFYLRRSTSERSSTSLRLFLPICFMYYYSLQIKMGFKTKKNKNTRNNILNSWYIRRATMDIETV
jgi:hypothetical protein